MEQDSLAGRLERALREDDEGRRLRTVLAAGGDPNLRVASDWTPLHVLAIRSGADAGQGHSIDVLIEYGADPNQWAEYHGDRWTPLHLAVYDGQLATVEALLRGGADPNSRTESGDTPLLLAADVADLKKIRILLDHGALISLLGRDGLGPLERAKHRLELRRRAVAEGSWSDQKLARQVLEDAEAVVSFLTEARQEDALGS